MPTHDSPETNGSGSPGYETTDVNVSGVAVFLASLGIFLAVFFVFCFGLGKVINTALVKNDGAPNKWNRIAGPPEGKPENMESSAAIEQQQLHNMVQRFATPRLQTDNGNQDVADLHAREDLLLDYYTWVDRQKNSIRIPIARAMELIAQRGLPVAPQTAAEPLMTADKAPVTPVPLTDGFARTGYEQQYLETLEQERRRGERPGQQVAMGANP